jgi:hypothetical protein
MCTHRAGQDLARQAEEVRLPRGTGHGEALRVRRNVGEAGAQDAERLRGAEVLDVVQPLHSVSVRQVAHECWKGVRGDDADLRVRQPLHVSRKRCEQAEQKGSCNVRCAVPPKHWLGCQRRARPTPPD